MAVEVRDYRPSDEQAWLRCRVLSFLGTAYFDDVCTSKPVIGRGAALVAVAADAPAGGPAIVGVLDLCVDGSLATIDTIAVHPDFRGAGLGTALFEQARIRAAALGATMIDAWTRDDEPTLAWYRARGAIRGPLGMIKVPTLYIWGDADDTVGRTAAEGTVDFVEAPYSFEVLPGVGHFAADQAPERVSELMLAHVIAHPV